MEERAPSILKMDGLEEGTNMPRTAEWPIESAKRRPALRGNPAERIAVEFDPLEDLCRLAEAYRKEHGLTADEAIERVLTKIRGRQRS